MTTVDIEIYKGQTYQKYLTVSGLTEPPIEVYLTVKESTQSKNIALQKTTNDGITLMEVNDDGDYVYLISIESEDTENFRIGYEYGYDITLITSKQKEPLVMGAFIVSGVYTGKEEE